MRRQRNDVQHEGRIPSAEETRLAATQVQDFLRAVVRDIAGMTLEELNLVSLIEDQESRERLRKAEQSLQTSGGWRHATKPPVEAWHTSRLQGSIATKFPELQRALGFTYFRIDLLNQLLQAREQFSMLSQSLTNFHEVRGEINERTLFLADDILGRMKQHQQALKMWEP